ncbi:MAG: VTT domain-containing protein [Acidobacteria bacterium]|nr:VTT domain-containing protein [Acidobacteriota bacterium]
MTPFLALAAATLISEDLTCIAAGTLIATGRIGFLEGTLACLTGIFLGDLLLFFSGRLFGATVLKLVPNLALRERAANWLEKRGAAAVLLSRFTPGLRLPVYLLAGLTRQHWLRFTAWFLAASILWTPILVGASARFGEAVIQKTLPFSGILPLSLVLLRYLPWRRIRHWEFWPIWAVYIPVVPWIAVLAVRYRSLRLPTLANPTIPTGGLTGESKSAILRHLPNVPPWQLVKPGNQLRSAHFPVVAKPDVGERGKGVTVLHTPGQLRRHLSQIKEPIILQHHVAGLEFGVYYCRMPWEERGRILSITHKQFPVVIGDGRGTVAALIDRDPRACIIASVYRANVANVLETIPAIGERIELAILGTHSRGSIFIDATHRNTPALEYAIDQIASCHPRFHLGRFDLRVPSMEAFQRGEDLSILELNGLGAEPTHIYDPSVGILDAYRALWRHWTLAFKIGAWYRKTGQVPSPWRLICGGPLHANWRKA